MKERTKFSCTVCGGNHPESHHTEGSAKEMRERKSQESIPDMTTRILGYPVRLRGLRWFVGGVQDNGKQVYLTPSGATIFCEPEKHRYVDETGKRVEGYDQEFFGRRHKLEARINKSVQERFPNSYDLLEMRRWDPRLPLPDDLRPIYETLLQRLRKLPREQLLAFDPWSVSENASRSELLAAIEKTFPDRITGLEAGHKDYRGKDLYVIGSFLKGEPLIEEDIPKNLAKLLRGKRILILGDDLGTLSEVLNAFGAKAYGLELDQIRRAIPLAHSGLFAENCKPQFQVVKGSYNNLVDSSHPVTQKIKNLGPFDICYSGPNVLGDVSGSLRHDGRWEQLFLALDGLLAPGGLNIHQGGDATTVTYSDRALALLYDMIRASGTDSRRKLLEEYYMQLRKNHADTGIWIVSRQGVEQDAKNILGRLTNEKDADTN